MGAKHRNHGYRQVDRGPKLRPARPGHGPHTAVELTISEYQSAVLEIMDAKIAGLQRLRGTIAASLLIDTRQYRQHLAATLKGWVNRVADDLTLINEHLANFSLRLKGADHAETNAGRP